MLQQKLMYLVMSRPCRPMAMNIVRWTASIMNILNCHYSAKRNLIV